MYLFPNLNSIYLISKQTHSLHKILIWGNLCLPATVSLCGSISCCVVVKCVSQKGNELGLDRILNQLPTLPHQDTRLCRFNIVMTKKTEKKKEKTIDTNN